MRRWLCSRHVGTACVGCVESARSADVAPGAARPQGADQRRPPVRSSPSTPARRARASSRRPQRTRRRRRPSAASSASTPRGDRLLRPAGRARAQGPAARSAHAHRARAWRTQPRLQDHARERAKGLLQGRAERSRRPTGSARSPRTTSTACSGLGACPPWSAAQFAWSRLAARRGQRPAQGRDHRAQRPGARRVRRVDRRQTSSPSSSRRAGSAGCACSYWPSTAVSPFQRPAVWKRELDSARRMGEECRHQRRAHAPAQPARRARPRGPPGRAERPHRVRLPDAQPRPLGRWQRQRADPRQQGSADLPRQRRELRAGRGAPELDGSDACTCCSASVAAPSRPCAPST